MLQAVPSQCSIRAGLLPPTSPHALHPAAQMSVGEIALILFSAVAVPVFGLVTTFHDVPFQCSMTVLFPSCAPAAHTLLVASAVTASRAAVGAGTRVHCRPLKCIVRAAGGGAEDPPTPPHARGDTTAMSMS